MVLSILIPTYNRSSYLKKNLEILTDFILASSLEKVVEIIVSNNCSTDDTKDNCEKLVAKYPLIIKYYQQDQNIGLQANALFVLSKSEATFVMYLGDDDYVQKEYFDRVIIEIQKDYNGCIIPSFKPIDMNGSLLNLPGRDIGMPVKTFEKGFASVYANSHRGHQLSGIVLRRNGLLDSYKNNCVDNIYLFIYFVVYCCYNYPCLHYTTSPVLVTAAPQANKDWTYKEDGLVSEMFDNYLKFNQLNYLQRCLLEYKLLKEQPRYFWYASKKNMIKAFFNIIKSDKTLFLVKVWLLLRGGWQLTKFGINRIIRIFK